MDKTILVIDDSKSMRQMVSFTLKQAGFTTLEGENGEEGLQQLNRQRVDLVVTDLNMPVMDGLTFIRQVRNCTDYKFTPILMLTTVSQESARLEGKAAGATGWIVKPFNPEQLLQVVNQVLPA